MTERYKKLSYKELCEKYENDNVMIFRNSPHYKYYAFVVMATAVILFIFKVVLI